MPFLCRASSFYYWWPPGVTNKTTMWNEHYEVQEGDNEYRKYARIYRSKLARSNERLLSDDSLCLQHRARCKFGSTIGRDLLWWTIHLLRGGNGQWLHQLLSAATRTGTGRARLWSVPERATALWTTRSGFSDGAVH